MGIILLKPTVTARQQLSTNQIARLAPEVIVLADKRPIKALPSRLISVCLWIQAKLGANSNLVPP